MVVHILVHILVQKLIQIEKKNLLMGEKEGWNYIAIKKLLALLRGIASKHCGDFFFELFSFVLEFNQYMKSDKMPHIIYADSEFPIEKYITVKTIQKNLKQKKYEIIFLADI